jgi:hypothetical protein
VNPAPGAGPPAGRSEAASGGRAWLLGALLVSVVLLAANHALVRGVAAPKWDGDEFFAPYFSLVADHARAGRILRWDPWSAGGSPDFADPQVGALSPITVLVGAITPGAEAGFRLYWLFLWLLGPLGLLALARHLGAPAWGGSVVALGFAFSGFYTGHAEHTSFLYPTAWLPLVIWRLDVALGSRRLGPAIEAGALWGLSALGGYPALTILTGTFLFLWALGRYCCPDDPEDRRPGVGFVALVVAVLFVLGVVVLSPVYVALLTETSGYSDRVGVLPRAFATGSNALHPGALATFASPYLSILKMYRNPLWEPTDISTASIYVGAPTVVLALLALAARPRSRWRWWLAGLGLVLLASALGAHVPVRGWLYDLFFPMRYFRHAGLFRLYAMLCAGVLALLATRDLQGPAVGPRTARWFLGAAAIAATGAVAAFALVLGSVDRVGDDVVRASVHLGLVWLGMVAAAALALGTGGTRRLPAALVVIAVLDAALTAGLTRPTTYDTGRPRRVWDLIDAQHDPRLDLTPHGLRRELRAPRWLGGQLNNKNLPLKIATLDNFVALGHRFHTAIARDPRLAASAIGGQRIWFARESVQAAPTDAAFAAFVRRAGELAALPLVVHARHDMARGYRPGEPGPGDAGDADRIAALGAAQRVEATVLAYRPNELDVEVSCPDAGWLLVTDRWAPGWQATVNGEPVELLGGNFVFRAVRVGAGRSAVRFAYRPWGWPGLLVASWGTLAAVVVGRSLVAWKRG